MGQTFRRFFCIEKADPFPPPQNQQRVAVQPSQHDLTLMNLKILRDDLYNQKKRMNLSIEKTDQEIRAHMSKNQKEAAIFAIKRKKLFEEYLHIAEDKYIFIQKAISEVEMAVIDKDLNDVMKQTNALLKDIQKSIDLEAMEEMKDNFAAVDEQKNAFNNLFDQYQIKEELEDEYNKYEAELVKDQFGQVDKNPVVIQSKKEVQNVQNPQKDNDLEPLMALE